MPRKLLRAWKSKAKRARPTQWRRGLHRSCNRTHIGIALVKPALSGRRRPRRPRARRKQETRSRPISPYALPLASRGEQQVRPIAASGYSVRGPGQGADLGEFAGQFAPRIAGILAGVELAVVTAGEDQAGIGRIGRERPDRRVRFNRQFRPLPTLPAILGALDRAGAAGSAIAGGDEDGVRVIRLQGQAAAVGQPELLPDAKPLPALAFVRARQRFRAACWSARSCGLPDSFGPRRHGYRGR